MLTKGAFGNLVNRYRAVLQKCNLINTFGSLAVAAMLVMGTSAAASAADFTLSGNTAWSDSTPYDSITNPGFTLTTNAASEFNAKVLDWKGNANDTGAIDGKIIAAEKFTYRGTGTNSYGRALKAAITAPLFEIIGTSGLQTGFSITSDAPLANVDKVYIEDNKGRTGLQFHNTSPISLNAAFELADKNGNGDARLELFNNSDVTFASGVTALEGKAKIQLNDNAVASIPLLTLKDNAILSFQTCNVDNTSTGSDGETTSVTLGEVTLGENSRLNASVPSAMMSDWKTPAANPDANPGISIKGDVVINLGKGAVADFAADGHDQWRPDQTKFDASSLTVNVADSSSGSKVLLGKGNTSTPASKISIVGAPSNNTGNAQKDLDALASSVQYSERGNYEDSFDASTGTADITKTTSVIEGASLKQETDGFYDEATGTVSAEGTAIVDKAPEAPAPETPTPETPAPETPAPETPTPETPAPEVTTPENAAPTNHNLNGIAEMSAVGLHIWRNEINDMNKRLGDLRASKGSKHGLWTRVYNGKARFGSLDVTNKYTAVQLGYDQQIMPGFWLGGAFSYTGGDSDFAKGDGSSDILAFTAYGSYLAENGLFVDVTAKYGFLSNEFDIALPGGIRSKGDYNTNAISFSGELGWHLTPFRCGFFLEPQLEVMYGVVESASYTTSTGIGVKQDSAHALIGRAGLMLGWKFDDFGSAYVRASVLRDFKGEADYSFHRDGVTRRLSEDLGDSWYEFGVGANCNITKNIQTYVDFETSHGGEVETDYRVNIGLRYSF